MKNRLRDSRFGLLNFWPFVLICSVWLFIFWPMLIGQTVVGFRDSAYLYYPLFKWIDAQWAAGEIPLWNPYCNFGYPVVADGSSSVFYPGKLIFFLRFLSYPSRYGIYVSIHILVAAFGAYWFARKLRANQAGATLAAISYAIGGSVLFQTVNVIFLVSASWLPFALCCVWRMYRKQRIQNAILAGCFCALMILGGDPQMTYLVGLIAVALLLGRFLRQRRRYLRSQNRTVLLGPYRWAARAIVTLTTMIVITSTLAAIQILPTCVWANKSVRRGVEPQNIYAATRRFIDQAAEQWTDLHYSEPGHQNTLEIAAASYRPLVMQPALGSQYEQSFQFSQPPWLIAEMFWPNIFGKPFPINRRWADQLPGADRVWTPSIYIGLLTVLLGVSSIRLWGRRRTNIWLSKIAVFFALGSFGWYGAVWFYNEFALLFQNQKPLDLGAPVGGVYWAMVMLLPKFFLFRYPAKLFVVTSLAVCLLAGRNLRLGRRMLPGWLMTTVLLATGLAGLILVLGQQIEFGNSASPLFGPFDKQSAFWSSLIAIAQTFVLSGVYLSLRPMLGKQIEQSHHHHRKIEILLVVLTAVELVIANHWLVPQVDSESFEYTTKISKKISTKSEIVPRYVRRNTLPIRWSETSSVARLNEIVTWQRETLHPKHHLEYSCSLTNSFCSIEPWMYASFSTIVDQEILNFNEKQFHRITQANGLIDLDLENREPEIYFQTPESQRVWFFPSEFELESDEDPSSWTWMDPGGREDHRSRRTSERIQDLHFEYKFNETSINRVRILVKATQPAKMLFNSLSESGWRIQVINLDTGETFNDCQIPAGIFFLGAAIPQGNIEVIFEYSPIEFWVGAWISSISWLLLSAAGCWTMVRTLRTNWDLIHFGRATC